jgi:hypothetical protein
MCYFSAEASDRVDAQTGDVLQVKTRVYGTNCVVVAGSNTVACLKPGTEVEISSIPWLWRWKAKLQPRTRVLFTSVESVDPRKRDGFILGNGEVVWLNELPHRLKMKVISVPVSQLSSLETGRKQVEDFEEDFSLAEID